MDNVEGSYKDRYYAAVKEKLGDDFLFGDVGEALAEIAGKREYALREALRLAGVLANAAAAVVNSNSLVLSQRIGVLDDSTRKYNAQILAMMK